MTMSSVTVAAIILLAGAGFAVWDISRTQERTIVVYTTPALRDVLERDVIPAFEKATRHNVAPVYVPAGQQFNRLRMSGGQPEADLFLHASPLYLEKGIAEDRVVPLALTSAAQLNESFRSREVEGGLAWATFAWSPLVSVMPSGWANEDLATTEASFGFPHPLLSNNGVYVVLFLEGVDDAIGERLMDQTRVQPTNARANIGGVADGSFDLTLGYEAVARFFQRQDARIDYALPLIRGENVTTRVLFSVAAIEGERHPGSDAFVEFLFSREAQAMFSRSDFRPVLPDVPLPEGAIPIEGARIIEQDWSRFAELEATLPNYEVKPGYKEGT